MRGPGVERVIAGSRFVAACRCRIDTLFKLVYTSRVGNGAKRLTDEVKIVWGGSVTESGTSRGMARIQRLVSGSQFVNSLSSSGTALTARISAATSTALTGDVWGLIERKTRESFFYRWLTAEPEPEVIVIDLRETYTAGPVIGTLDRTIAELTPGIESATVTQAAAAGAHRFRHRPVRYLGFALAAFVGASASIGAITSTLTGIAFAIHLLLFVVAIWGTRSTRTAEELLAHPVSQWLMEAFEPPEPIEPVETREDERE